MRYHPRIIQGENGHVAAIEGSDGSVFEIHPLGDAREKEFYLLAAAEQLAVGHAAIANSRGTHEGMVSLREVR